MSGTRSTKTLPVRSDQEFTLQTTSDMAITDASPAVVRPSPSTPSRHGLFSTETPPPFARRQSMKEVVLQGLTWGQIFYRDFFVAVRGLFAFLRDPAVAAVVIAAILTHAFQSHRLSTEESVSQIRFFEDNMFNTLRETYMCDYRPRVPYFEREEVAALRSLLQSNETGVQAITGASNSGKSTALCLAAEGLKGIVYIPFKRKSSDESIELFVARILRYSGSKPTEKLAGGVLREPLYHAIRRLEDSTGVRPIFILDDVQVGLVDRHTEFDRDFNAALTMLGDMSHEILLITMSSDHRFVPAFQRLAGIRDRLKVVVFPYLRDELVEKYLTHAVAGIRFPAEDAALIARTVGGHMGNIVECILDAPRYGLRVVLNTIVSRAAEQFRDALLTPPCTDGRQLICDSALQNGFEIVAFELFSAMSDCQTDADILVHQVIAKCSALQIPARSVRRAVVALIEENILRHVDAERVGWHAPRFCAAWQIVSSEREVIQAIKQAKDIVASRTFDSGSALN